MKKEEFKTGARVNEMPPLLLEDPQKEDPSFIETSSGV